VNDRPNGMTRNAERAHVRKFARAPVSMEVSYVVDGMEDRKTAHASDLGGGGVRLSTDEDLALGTILLLRFHASANGREVVARGRIVLSFFNADAKRYFHGIAFTQIDPRDQEEIIRFIASEIDRTDPLTS